MAIAAVDEVADGSTEARTRPFGREALPRRVRLGILVVGLLAGLAVLGVRYVDRLDRPHVGDRHDVTFDIYCGSAHLRFDGLAAQAGDDVFLHWPGLDAGSDPAALWPSAIGHGTVELTEVRDLDPDIGDGVHVEGTLTLDDGRTFPFSGGTDGQVFFTLGCAIAGP